ncbi:CC-NBS-LRR resistance protein [Trifolium medium]|uniref:CC-NBS-LRR resistance protein n=1 Tax=Trifolium medium TaxID=97028 RepID=A0A392LYY5_9FABA|nr:CC-NBS-LRR resistance protein [Trifolium medium]
MAEQNLFGVAESLIKSLASAALREFGRINGVLDELERLKNTVESIRAVLLDAEDKQDQSHAVQNWIRRLKDVLIPADDLLDEFVIQDMIYKRDEAHRNKVTKVLHSLSPNRIAFRHKMAHEIEKVQKQFNDVVKDMSGLNLNPHIVVVEQSNNVRRETCSFVLESDIIGREDDKKEIINLLKQHHGNQNVSLGAIVGIGGLGKTALAQLVYNDGEVQNLFEKHMWVCVSETFEVKTILKKMLESLTKNKIDDSLSLDNLQNMFRDNLNGKRYLLVLDDVWNDNYEKWAQLRTYLMCGARGSKVLVTTRSTNVAQTMGVSVPYVLNGLILEESWSLLKKITFGDDTIEVNRTIESIGNKIAKKCKGVPLAIRSLGGILQSKSEEKEWINVLQGDFWKLCEDKESILPVLKLSYQNLSPEQRQCFAYCSLYPKDWVIEKDELIQMWMGQGYLECSDVGNQFVKLFLMKSFFQDANMNQDGDINGFKMHDLMHDLATQVAGNDCCYLGSKEKRCLGRPMHVSMDSDAYCLLESLDASRLRTLILFTSPDEKKLAVVSNFKFLRVLKLKYSSMSMLSSSIEKLKHLRYLNLLRCYGLESLPKSIDNLVCLQTIKVSLDEEVVLSTKVISKLINLRHLEINEWIYKDMMSVGQHKGMIFSKWLSPLTNITEISLRHCAGLRHLPPMERLPFLKSLELTSLYDLVYICYEEPILHESFFPSLESLQLHECDELKGWMRVGDDFNDINSSHHILLPQFSCLSKLIIIRCPMLTCMPTFPNIKTLSLKGFGVEILEATLSQCSIGSPPFSMLKSLQINDNFMDGEKVPHDWLQNLISLKNLDLVRLSSQHFQAIEIWFKDDINYLPSLQKITFLFCNDLKALPDWICKISSLQHIKIDYCHGLSLLPKGMTRLTNLHTLEIIGCTLLIQECQKETTTIFRYPRIAHIPNIIIK